MFYLSSKSVFVFLSFLMCYVASRNFQINNDEISLFKREQALDTYFPMIFGRKFNLIICKLDKIILKDSNLYPKFFIYLTFLSK